MRWGRPHSLLLFVLHSQPRLIQLRSTWSSETDRQRCSLRSSPSQRAENAVVTVRFPNWVSESKRSECINELFRRPHSPSETLSTSRFWIYLKKFESRSHNAVPYNWVVTKNSRNAFLGFATEIIKYSFWSKGIQEAQERRIILSSADFSSGYY